MNLFCIAAPVVNGGWSDFGLSGAPVASPVGQVISSVTETVPTLNPHQGEPTARAPRFNKSGTVLVTAKVRLSVCLSICLCLSVYLFV